MKLTDRTVAGFPLSEIRKEYSDDAVPGLTVRVGKTTKTFRLVIGTGAARKRFTLGDYPILSLAQAREKARDIIAKERLNATETPRTTFEEALELYYRTKLATLRPASIRAKESALERHFRPAFGKRPLADIRRSDIAPILDGITAPAARHSAFKYLATFLNWAVKRGYIETAPPPPHS